MFKVVSPAILGLVSLLVAGAGCSAGAAGDPEQGAALDLSLAAGKAVTVGSTQASVKRDFDLTVDGTGDSVVQKVSLTHGVGSIELAGVEVPALALYEQDGAGLGAGGTDLLQIFAVEKTRLTTLWAYCTAGQLYALYYETTDGLVSVSPVDASGTCTVGSATVTEKLALPAVDFSFPAAVTGYAIKGPDISLRPDGSGDVRTLGREWNLYPFNVVDCSDCATPGWLELHSLLWNAASRRACFGIFYLEQDEPKSVELDYPMCLGGGSVAPDETPVLAATWSAPAGDGGASDSGAPSSVGVRTTTRRP